MNIYWVYIPQLFIDRLFKSERTQKREMLIMENAFEAVEPLQLRCRLPAASMPLDTLTRYLLLESETTTTGSNCFSTLTEVNIFAQKPGK